MKGDTIANRCPDDAEYKVSISVKTEEGYNLVLKSKNSYDEETSTQLSPSIYELYDNKELLQREEMNFQIHLYEIGEMENILYEIGFNKITVYSSFGKDVANSNNVEMFLYECIY